MKKKFLAMALGIAVVLSCTACGGGSSDAIQQQAETQQ